MGRLYILRKQAHGGQLPKGSGKDYQSVSTADHIAAEFQVSPKTVKRAGQLAAKIDSDPELQKAANLKETHDEAKKRIKKDKKAKLNEKRNAIEAAAT